MDDRERLITTAEAAQRIGVTTQAMSQWRAARRGPKFVRFGKVIRYSSDEINRWISSNTVETDDA